MKTFLTIILTVIATIIIEFLLIVGYVYYANPFGIKDMFFPQDEQTQEEVDGEKKGDSSAPTEDANPLLSEEQEQQLRNFGIDPATLPTTYSAEQEACAREKLGDERTEEIKAGDSPTASELFKLRGCM